MTIDDFVTATYFVLLTLSIVLLGLEIIGKGGKNGKDKK